MNPPRLHVPSLNQPLQALNRITPERRRDSLDSNKIHVPPLKEILRDPELRGYILAYASRNYQDESLLFWIAADAFPTLPCEKRLEAAQAIWGEFLEPMSDHEVTVEAGGRVAMGELLAKLSDKDEVPVTLFEDMKLELENVMTSNVYSEYSKQVRQAGALDFAVKEGKEQILTPAENEARRLKGANLMENLVIEPDNFSVLFALCQVYTIVEQHDEEERAFLSGVVEILLEHQALLPFMQYVITREVAECSQVNTLFRGRTVFVLLLGDLLRRRACVKFLSDLTSATFSEVMRHKGVIEVDPFRIDNSADKESESLRNAEKLVKLADQLMEAIRKRYLKCPPTLRKVFDLVSVHTAVKFPELRWKMVGAVFFLRFINPALSQPERYGLVSKEVSMGNRRALVMLSKMLQYVTNDSRFDVTAPSFVILNNWVDSNVAKIEGLFAQLIVVSDTDWATTDVQSPGRATSRRGSANNVSELPGKGFQSSPVSSPRSKTTSKWTAKIKSFKGSERLGRNLTVAESQALRLAVLDTLIHNQERVKELLSRNMATQTQWIWLKESLSSFLK